MPPAPVGENTPLIQTVVVAPRRERYSHSLLRRLCTFALCLVLVIIVILFLIPSRLLPGDRGRQEELTLSQDTWSESSEISRHQLQKILLETPSASLAREWSKYYTSGPHLAGKNLTQAEWTRDKWQEFGIDAKIVAYEIYINYPVSHRLALLDGENVKYEAILEEDTLEDDPTTELDERVPTFHGYSASGNVTGQYIYVNYGTFFDFEDLLNAGVELKGKIALAKYGHVFRGLKVKRAQELGMIGVVIYSDPQEDGEVTELHGYQTYPEGPARNPSSVQRGSVQFINVLPGDPTTPGYPSLPGAPRTNPTYSTPQIPSLPISYKDAVPLLLALNGHGPKASDFNQYWQGGGLTHKGVEYNIGPSPPGLTLNVHNEQEYVVTPLWDVIGTINGSIPDEVVVLGNHRDAWIAGGAGDPNSGSAAMNEVVRSFGVALKKGWKPLRTLVFGSWDGEEYGLIGSTEWVEEHIAWLSATAVAYLNVDVATSGPQFIASASPLLNKALRSTARLVPSPNQTVAGQTIADVWSGHIGTMGSGSDFTAFQDFAGIPSLDMGFKRGPGMPVYHYHSNYDSFHWMDTFGDPGFEYHIAAAQLLSLLAVSVAENPLVGLNATDYAVGLAEYLDTIKTGILSSQSRTPSSDPSNPASSEQSEQADLNEAETYFLTTSYPLISHAIAHLLNASIALDAAALSFSPLVHPSTSASSHDKHTLRKINQKYIQLERHFLHPAGLDSRPWFKHVVFAPGIWTGYAGDVFPGIVEALSGGGGGWHGSQVTEDGLRGADGTGIGMETWTMMGGRGGKSKGDLDGVRKWTGIIAGKVWGAVNMLEE